MALKSWRRKAPSSGWRKKKGGGITKVRYKTSGGWKQKRRK